MCFLWGVWDVQKTEAAQNWGSCPGLPATAAEECLLLKEVADCALKAKYKVYSSEVLGKRRHQAGSKMGHCLLLWIIPQTLLNSCISPPKNPNLARPNHLIRGLLSRENVSSYSEIVWFGVKQGRQKAYFECSNKVYCRALVLNVHLKSTSLGSNLFLEVHPDLFMSCLGTANITCLWRWSLNSFQNCVRLFLLSRKLIRCVKGWTGL